MATNPISPTHSWEMIKKSPCLLATELAGKLVKTNRKANYVSNPDITRVVTLILLGGVAFGLALAAGELSAGLITHHLNMCVYGLVLGGGMTTVISMVALGVFLGSRDRRGGDRVFSDLGDDILGDIAMVMRGLTQNRPFFDKWTWPSSR